MDLAFRVLFCGFQTAFIQLDKDPGEGGLPEKLGGGVQPASQNPYHL